MSGSVGGVLLRWIFVLRIVVMLVLVVRKWNILIVVLVYYVEGVELCFKVLFLFNG